MFFWVAIMSLQTKSFASYEDIYGVDDEFSRLIEEDLIRIGRETEIIMMSLSRPDQSSDTVSQTPPSQPESSQNKSDLIKNTCPPAA